MAEKTRTARLEDLLSRIEESKDLAGNISRDKAERFLHNRNFDVGKALALLEANYKWRKEMRIDDLRISHVQSQLQTQKFVIPGTVDKKGRPIILFNAGKHDPNSDFVETLKLAVYGFETAVKSMGEGIKEITIIENLDGFTKENADNRMVKYLLEVVQTHYPGRIGQFIAVNAPWYYRLLFKVVKPWLSSDLLSKVQIFSDVEKLPSFVSRDQLPKELGGEFEFSFDSWISEQAKLENVELDHPTPFSFAPQIIAAFSDFPLQSLTPNAIKHGLMKKQGGFVRKFNKRYCVLTETIFYYYKEDNQLKPEGFVELVGASISKQKGQVFVITTAVHKSCIFKTDSKSFDSWFSLLSDTIKSLNVDLVNWPEADGELLISQDMRASFDVPDENVSLFLYKDFAELENLISRARQPSGVETFEENGKQIFQGTNLVKWLIENSVVQTQSGAISLGDLLIKRQLIFSTKTDSFSTLELYSFK